MVEVFIVVFAFMILRYKKELQASNANCGIWVRVRGVFCSRKQISETASMSFCVENNSSS